MLTPTLMTKKEAKQLRRLITQYRNAAIEDAFKGGGDPDAIPYIEEHYAKSWDRLNAFITHHTKAAS